MSIVILGKTLTAEDLRKAREEYREYIKITLDIKEGIVAVGGEYHADAEQLLMKQYGCKQRDIWGGGYNFQTHQFETNAIINLRGRTNTSLEILLPKIREAFLEIAKKKLKHIRRLL